MSGLLQDAVDHVVWISLVYVLQDLVHSGGVWTAGQDHPLLIFGSKVHPDAATSASAEKTTNLTLIQFLQEVSDTSYWKRKPVQTTLINTHFFNNLVLLSPYSHCDSLNNTKTEQKCVEVKVTKPLLLNAPKQYKLSNQKSEMQFNNCDINKNNTLLFLIRHQKSSCFCFREDYTFTESSGSSVR